MNARWPILATLAVAMGRAALAALFALPAGPPTAVAVASALGLKARVPVMLRDCAYLLIGVSLGAGIDAGVVAQLPHWSISLLVLALSLVATMALSSWMLQRVFGLDRDTAALASSPGTMSNVVAIAAEGRGDATTVMILQLVRLVLLVTCVPPVTVLINLPDVAQMVPRPTMPLAGLVLLVASGLPLGRWLGRKGVPAACLLTGLLLSAALHAGDILHGAAAPWLVFAAFGVTGAVIGTRIGGISPRAALRLAGAGVTVVLTVLALSILFALATQALTGLPLGMILVAYAPGGVEAMAAIGLALGYDPAYVAAHHFARIVLLVGFVPLFMQRGSAD